MPSQLAGDKKHPLLTAQSDESLNKIYYKQSHRSITLITIVSVLLKILGVEVWGWEAGGIVSPVGLNLKLNLIELGVLYKW